MVPQLQTRTVIEAKLIEELLYLLKQCWIVALDALPIVLNCPFLVLSFSSRELNVAMTY